MNNNKQQVTLQRNNTNGTSGTTSSSSYSFYSSNKMIIPSNYNYNYLRSTTPLPIVPQGNDTFTEKLLVRSRNCSSTTTSSSSSSSNVRSINKVQIKLTSLLRSIFFKFPNITIPTCKWLSVPAPPDFSLTPNLGRKVTGTLFGYRRGHVSFAVQDDPRSEPAILLELAVSTAALVKEMSSGLVRIALECEKGDSGGGGHMVRKLHSEPTWTMYCNGRSCGYAVSRTCTELDLHVLSTVRTVSVGAGVIPIPMVEDGKESMASRDEGGHLLYMRAKFERVVGSRDSEAFYMMNPDGNAGPELCIFLLRL